MKWSMDTHKYMSEVTRTALQVIVKHNISSESEPEAIDTVERELAAEGVYKDYEGAKGRIRRALFTYFKAYGCMKDNEQLTEMGKAFIDNRISIQEFSFWYVLNYEYAVNDDRYYPAHLVLKCIKMFKNIDASQAYISPFDFSRLVECDSLDDVNDALIQELLDTRNGDVPTVNERTIGYDVWAKMFVQAGIFNRNTSRNLVMKNEELVDWILLAYENTVNVSRGKIATGVLEYLPILPLGNASGEVEPYKNESAALRAILFDSINEGIIDKYIIRNTECSLEKMKSTLGLVFADNSFYRAYDGLERLVGYTLMNNTNPVVKTIGEILVSVELSEEFLNEISETEENVEIEENQVDYDKADRFSYGVNVLLYGVPGSGKSWTIEHEYCKKDSKVERLVFHPDYTYSDFIGQILPVVAEDGQVSYQFTAGPFTNILHAAYVDPGTEYILIIEEINRGNAPAIFGEVFQLLDRKVEIREKNDDGFPIGTSEYGITNANIAKIVYGDASHKVRIPSNLSIIGTMNTSDQNVFTLDTAFQRRWDMRLIENNFDNVDSELANATILDTDVTWKDFCTEINNIVVGNSARMTASEDKRLGAYFVHLRDLLYDENMGDLSEGEYDSLRKKERSGDITTTEQSKLLKIREAMKQNRKFPEKVIKYLWDDAFKFNREVIFETTDYQSLEQVVRAFMYAKGIARFKMFKENVTSAFTNSEQ